MADFPNYLILPYKIYSVSYKQFEGGRAFDRMLVDFGVEGHNPFEQKDNFRTRLGATEQLADDYSSFKESVPLQWLLARFLMHHVRSNSIDIISGPGGEVLTTKNYKYFLGTTVDDSKAEAILSAVLSVWTGYFPEKTVALANLYCATDIEIVCLRRTMNRLKAMGAVMEAEPDIYKINLLSLRSITQTQEKPVPSLDRRLNRYFQEIKIAAKEPFCFIIMPFRETEFPQRIYYEVIKPYIQNIFGIYCYRVDEDGIPDRIDNKIYTYLLRASFVIAEITTLNPNVLYELGLAHMLEKDCIILTQNLTEDLPFDINRISSESYNNDAALIEILQDAVMAMGFSTKVI